jgi:hypothetical protein
MQGNANHGVNAAKSRPDTQLAAPPPPTYAQRVERLGALLSIADAIESRIAAYDAMHRRRKLALRHELEKLQTEAETLKAALKSEGL